MSEPMLSGVPLTLMFLYFVWYSFLGWCMESAFCSIRQHRLVDRGFLHLPLCPIYGAGVLIMVVSFAPLVSCLPLFYVVATVVMSAWEFFVGWLLEVTTHVRYWDYSHRRFNLKGRICLGNSLWWGVASYLVILWIHPATESLFSQMAELPRQVLAILLAIAILADTAITVRQLALLTKALAKAEEARVQMELARKELQTQLEQRRQALQDHVSARADALQQDLEPAVDRARADLARLDARRAAMTAEVEKRAARFAQRYIRLSSRRYPDLLSELRRRAGSRRRKKSGPSED